MKTYSLLPTFTNLFDEVLGSEILDRNIAYFQPKANILEKETSFELELLVPGFEKENFSLSIDKNNLIIEGKIQNDKRDFKQNEFIIRSFKRSFILPENIDLNKIEASYTNGILKLNLPKKEVFVKKIEISVK